MGNQEENNLENNELVEVKTGELESTISREIEEVKVRMLVAQSKPRRIITVSENIQYVCKKYKMAERAMYSYPKGGITVTGPSIHLAKELANLYGHIDYGYRETVISATEVRVEAYCVDLQSNVKETRTFTVNLFRDTTRGPVKLTSERDKYEHVANFASRRVRACILGVIPSYFVEEAIETCDATLRKGDGNTSFEESIQIMIKAFKPLGVNVEDIEERLGHKVEAMAPSELVTFKNIYTAIKDGASDRSAWFKAYKKSDSDSEKMDKFNDKLNKKETETTETTEEKE